MFYNSRHININAMVLLLSATYNVKLVGNIHDAYSHINLNNIADVEIRNLVEVVKIFSDDIFKKEIRTPKQAQAYFEIANLPEDIKIQVQEGATKFSDKVLDEYNAYFASVHHHDPISGMMENLNKKWDKLSSSGLSKIKKNTEDFIETVHKLTHEIKTLTKDTMDYNDFVINVHDTDGSAPSFGLDKVEENVVKSVHNRLRTGTWIDNVTGGGFRSESLYVVCSISGGFKSGFLQNVAEEISCNMKVEDFMVPEGMMPALLYVNLEMSDYQLARRKINFYNGDVDYVLHGVGAPEGTNFESRLRDLITEKGSNVPVIYLSEDSTSRKYTINKLKSAVERYEQSGYKIIGIITDYLDKFKFNVEDSPSERERDEPITLKAYEHKDLAKELKIPVITGAQMNKAGEDALKGKLHRAGYEDIVKGCNPTMIGKAHSLTNVPEQIYFCYKYPVGSNWYFSLVVDKDRDNMAKYVNPDNVLLDKDEKKKKKPSKKKMRGDSRVHYTVKMDTFINDKGEVDSAFRIGNNYASSIRDFEDGSDAYDVFDIDNDIDDIEDAEVVKDELTPDLPKLQE